MMSTELQISSHVPCKIQSWAVSKYEMSENDFTMCFDRALFMTMSQRPNEGEFSALDPPLASIDLVHSWDQLEV